MLLFWMGSERYLKSTHFWKNGDTPRGFKTPNWNWDFLEAHASLVVALSVTPSVCLLSVTPDVVVCSITSYLFFPGKNFAQLLLSHHKLSHVVNNSNELLKVVTSCHKSSLEIDILNEKLEYRKLKILNLWSSFALNILTKLLLFS